MRSDLEKLDSFTSEASKNHLIRNFLRNGRLRVKFVKFEIDENEDLEGPEEKEGGGYCGGIDKNRKWVKSHYFKRLIELGDYRAATFRTGGYSRPYIDFAISKIHKNYFYVIGEFRF